MTEQIQLGDIIIDVVKKKIKHMHLSIHPPAGKVRVSAPLRMDSETIRLFVISKLAWIRKHQQRMQEQHREAPREYVERESHYVWGKRYLLRVVEKDAAPFVVLKHDSMQLHVRPETGKARRQEIVSEWYRELVKEVVPDLIEKWEPVMGVRVRQFFVQKMKTRWGSCNYRQGNIRLNTELAKKPPECLEYVVVHEMAHLLEPSHNSRFIALMDSFMPQWREHRDELKRTPLGHEDWVA
ncbi:MAG TPA: SprT family zinc-dependent metalloprotease [Deltaproteobacteria bacterium]|nr:SprT family zinc-dependent metalloprotease [Deltaproteobacteria bacterium]HQB39869.1 SprT family zinc-dependent metalloprotease [Deltaproteobacteria bacterium]